MVRDRRSVVGASVVVDGEGGGRVDGGEATAKYGTKRARGKQVEKG